MEKRPPYYSPNTIHYQLYKYECVISNKICFCFDDVAKAEITIHRFELGDYVYWVFTSESDYNLN